MKKLFSGKSAFSLIELSIVVLIIGILVAGVTQGSRLVRQSRIKIAQNLTNSSGIPSIPNLVLWLEPTLENSITSATNSNNPEDGDLISSWNDSNTQSLAKINVTQVTSVNQPTYTINGINGLPSLKFNNSILYATSAPITAGNDAYTMVAVWSSNAIQNTLLIEQRPTTYATVNSYAGLWLNGTGGVQFTGYSNDSAVLSTIVTNKSYIDVMVINNSLSNNVTNYLNSNTAVTSVTSGSGGGPSNLNVGNYSFSVGGRTQSPINTYNGLANAILAEVIIFDRALKKSEVADINNYLSKKYNIIVN